MPAPKTSWWFKLWSRQNYHDPKKPGRRTPAQVATQLRSSSITSRLVSTWGRSRFEEFLDSRLYGRRNHFGPKVRMPDLFERRDRIYFALEAQRLQWYMPPPIIYHDLLHAAAKVGHIEERIGYIFKDKMTCIEALKTTSNAWPLYYKGVVQRANKNNRLALLGDRVLGLALCEIWFYTGNTPGDYSVMSAGTETRAMLDITGKALGIDRNLLMHSAPPTHNQVAEAFEAVLGAVYLDSDHSLSAVKDVLKQIELDKHKYLKADMLSQHAQQQKDIVTHRNFEAAEEANQARARRQANNVMRAKKGKSQPKSPTDSSTVGVSQMETGNDVMAAHCSQLAATTGEVTTVPTDPPIWSEAAVDQVEQSVRHSEPQSSLSQSTGPGQSTDNVERGNRPSKGTAVSLKSAAGNSVFDDATHRGESLSSSEGSQSPLKVHEEVLNDAQTVPNHKLKSQHAVATAKNVALPPTNVANTARNTAAILAVATDEPSGKKEEPKANVMDAEARKKVWAEAAIMASGGGKKGKAAVIKEIYQGLLRQLVYENKSREELEKLAPGEKRNRPGLKDRTRLARKAEMLAAVQSRPKKATIQPLAKVGRPTSKTLGSVRTVALDDKDEAQRSTQPAPVPRNPKLILRQRQQATGEKVQDEDEKKLKIKVKRVKQLEQDIINSHNDVWQGAEAPNQAITEAEKVNTNGNKHTARVG